MGGISRKISKSSSHFIRDLTPLPCVYTVFEEDVAQQPTSEKLNSSSSFVANGEFPHLTVNPQSPIRTDPHHHSITGVESHRW